MPEGRWASACSLTCILPGVNETRTVLDEPFAIGADVCISHVDDTAATMGPGNASLHAGSAIQKAVKMMSKVRRQSANRLPAAIVEYEPHVVEQETRPHCPTGSRLADGRPWWPAHPYLLPIAKDDAADGHRQLVADEAMVFGALSMARNVLGGGLYRHVGVYDLLAVSVQRLGVCVDFRCYSVAAVDTTRPSVPTTRCSNASLAEEGGDTESNNGSPLARCSTTNVPIITHVGPDGIERPVHMESSSLLALGRGMLGSPRWFERASTPFHLGGTLTLRGPTVPVPETSKTGLLSIQDGRETTQWDLNGTAFGNANHSPGESLPASPTSTPFLAHLATVVCAGKLRSFLVSSSACDNIRPWGHVRRASGSTEIQGNIMNAGVWAGVGKVNWKVTPTILASAAADAASTSHHALPYQRPAWTAGDVPSDTVTALADFVNSPIQVTPPELIGRPSREVNPSSAAESKLANSLFQRQLMLPPTIVAGQASASSHLDLDATATVSELLDTSDTSVELASELNRLSQAYDRRVFHKEHPAPPVSSADLVLAVIVMVPELGALLGLLLTTERWSRPALLGFCTIIVFGAVSISGVIALASQEAAGAAWRARSTRTAANAVFAAGDMLNEFGRPSAVGTLVVVEKSFLLLAPTMYRPARVQLVAAVLCGAYMVSTAVMAARVLYCAIQQRRDRRVDVEAPPPATANKARAPRKARRWWRRRARASARGTFDKSDSEDDGDGDGETGAAGARHSNQVGTAVSGAGVPPWPASAGGFYYPSWWGVGRGGGWA